MIGYLNALDNLGMTIFEMLAHGLGLPDDFFKKHFEEKEATMIRVNRYPPCPLPEKCLGLGSHSDPHTLTILLQDNVGGLQVLMSDNKWIGIRPVQNSFIINIGDTLEVISLSYAIVYYIIRFSLNTIVLLANKCLYCQIMNLDHAF